MKRSEMIARMAEQLQWDGLETSGVPVEEIADDLLKTCERAGMLPPYNPPSLDHGYVGDCQWDPECEIPEYAFKCLDCTCEGKNETNGDDK